MMGLGRHEDYPMRVALHVTDIWKCFRWRSSSQLFQTMPTHIGPHCWATFLVC